MCPNTLDKNAEYNYYHWQFFKNHLNITRSFIDKNYNIGMHEQEFYEVNIIVKGKGMHYILNNKISTKVGDVFVIPPHTPHGYQGGEGFDVFHLLLSDDFINKHFTDLQQLPSFSTLFSAEPLMRTSTSKTLHLSLTKNQFKHANKLLGELLSLQDLNNPYECLKSTNLTMILLTYFCEVYSNNFSQAKNLTKDQYFMSTLSYIHEHYHEKISLTKLVELSQMSRSSYINKFKKICNMSPVSYLNKTRIKAAENLLLNTSIPIAEIAFKTGFYDCAHFTKMFVSEKNITPFNYRKSNNKN